MIFGILHCFGSELELDEKLIFLAYQTILSEKPTIHTTCSSQDSPCLVSLTSISLGHEVNLTPGYG